MERSKREIENDKKDGQEKLYLSGSYGIIHKKKEDGNKIKPFQVWCG